MGALGDERARRGVGGVVELLGEPDDPLASLLADVGVAVERPRDGAHGDAAEAGELLDCGASGGHVQKRFRRLHPSPRRMSRAGLRHASPPARHGRGTSRPDFAHPILRGVGRQVAIAFALLVALGVLVAAMAWSTAARGQRAREDRGRPARGACRSPSSRRPSGAPPARWRRTSGPRPRRSRSARAPAPAGRRSVRCKIPAQRSLYRRGARTLWKALGEVAVERAAFDAYRPGVRALPGPLRHPARRLGRSRPAWTPGASAWSSTRPTRRSARAASSTGWPSAPGSSRRTWRRTTSRATSTTAWCASSSRPSARPPGATGARATPRRCEAARDRLIELGANDGYATFFAFGHSLRG